MPSNIETQTIATHKTIVVFFILLLACLGPFATDIYAPSLPAMVIALHSSKHIIQLSITTYLFGFTFAQLFYGPWSDRLGRKPIIMTGLLICLLGTVLCTTAHNGTELLIGRLIQGIGMAGITSLIRAVLCDVFYGEQFASMLSYISVVFSFAPAIAPIIGGYLQSRFDWQANFILLLFYIAVITLFFNLFFPETHKNYNQHATAYKTLLKNYAMVLTHSEFMRNVICSSLAVSSMIAYISMTPFLFQNVLHISPFTYGMLAACLALALFFSKIVNGYLVKYFGCEKMIAFGIWLSLFASLTLLILGLYGILNLVAIMLPVMGVITGAGFIAPNAAVNAFSPFVKIAGSVGAVYGSVQILGTFITSSVVTGFHTNNQIPLGFVLCGLSVLSIICYYGLLQRREINEH